MTKRSYLVLLLSFITLVFGLATGFDLFYRLVYILLLILAISFLWNKISLWRVEIDVERRATMAQVGDTISERIWINNPAWLPKIWLEVEDLSNLPGHTSGRIITLPGKSFRSWRVDTLCNHRGLYTLGPLRVSSGDPFGLFQRERIFPGTHRLLVYPRIVELPTFRVPSSDLPGDGNMRMRTVSTTPQVVGIREYIYGDNVHRIHWPSTLRLGKLMSREFESGFATDTWLFLDFQASIQSEIREDTTDETMVTISASIAAKLLRMQLAVGMIAHGSERYFLQAQRGSAQLDRMLGELARSRAEGGKPLEQALAEEERRFNRFSTLIILTSSWHEEWVTAVRVLQRRGVRIVVVLIDGESFGGTITADYLTRNLSVNGIPYAIIQRGDDLDVALNAIHRPLGRAHVASKESSVEVTG